MSTDSGRIVIVGYRPLPGKAAALLTLLRTHVQRLQAEGLATDRPSILMAAQDGTIVEVFEWTSQAAIDSAHSNAAVQAMWQEYAEVCEYVPVGELPESQQLFSGFAAV